jgi:superfamily II DNA helicase RecQ
MLLSWNFIDDVLKNQLFKSRIYSVIIDEAHCISHWGADFRKKYSLIGGIHSFLPQNTPFIAVSASLTRCVTQDIVYLLQLDQSNFLHLNLGNNRPTVSLVIRTIHNMMSSYTDLNFVMPTSIQAASDILKTWIYADNINTGTEIVDHLHTLLPNASMHNAICPYNTVLDIEYQHEAMQRFKDGEVCILVCTDAASMVCSDMSTNVCSTCLHKYMDRAAMSLTLILSYNGRCQGSFQALSSVLGVL